MKLPWRSSLQKQRPSSHDTHLYAMRNIVERVFCTMKDMKRLASRFEKQAIDSLNMIYIFAI